MELKVGDRVFICRNNISVGTINDNNSLMGTVIRQSVSGEHPLHKEMPHDFIVSIAKGDDGKIYSNSRFTSDMRFYTREEVIELMQLSIRDAETKLNDLLAVKEEFLLRK